MVNTWESLGFLAALSSPAHKCILKWSNLFWWRVISKQWLPGETGENAQLHLDMSTERTTSHTQANWFARGWAQPERPSPCWLNSRGAQQHSGLDPPLQAEPDLGFQQTHEPHRKAGENSGSFWKILDSQIQTSWMDLQIHTKYQRMATEVQPFAIPCLSWIQRDPLPFPEILPMFPWDLVLPMGWRSHQQHQAGEKPRQTLQPLWPWQSVLLAAGRAPITPQPPQEQDGKIENQWQ